MATQTEFCRFNALQLSPDSTGKKMALVRNLIERGQLWQQI